MKEQLIYYILIGAAAVALCVVVKCFDWLVHRNCEADRLRRAKELCDANPSGRCGRQ